MNVVVIDDDVALLRSIEILLAGKGHRVAAYTAPDSALASLSGKSADSVPPVDVLLVDFVLSRCTALDFLEANRKHFDHCKVILMSGHTDLVELFDLRKIGVDAFLPKPLDFNRLCELIGEGARVQAPENHRRR